MLSEVCLNNAVAVMAAGWLLAKLMMRGRAVAMRCDAMRAMRAMRAMDEPLREGWAGDTQ